MLNFFDLSNAGTAWNGREGSTSGSQHHVSDPQHQAQYQAVQPHGNEGIAATAAAAAGALGSGGGARGEIPGILFLCDTLLNDGFCASLNSPLCMLNFFDLSNAGTAWNGREGSTSGSQHHVSDPQHQAQYQAVQPHGNEGIAATAAAAGALGSGGGARGEIPGILFLCDTLLNDGFYASLNSPLCMLNFFDLSNAGTAWNGREGSTSGSQHHVSDPQHQAQYQAVQPHGNEGIAATAAAAAGALGSGSGARGEILGILFLCDTLLNDGFYASINSPLCMLNFFDLSNAGTAWNGREGSTSGSQHHVSDPQHQAQYQAVQPHGNEGIAATASAAAGALGSGGGARGEIPGILFLCDTLLNDGFYASLNSPLCMLNFFDLSNAGTAWNGREGSTSGSQHHVSDPQHQAQYH